MQTQTDNKEVVSKQDEWFENLIATIKTDKFMLETGTADEKKKRMYGIMMNGTGEENAQLNIETARKYFIPRILIDYLAEFTKRPSLKLALDLNHSELLVWAEIANDDEAAEDFLLMAEATVNAKYHRFGYDLSSTIVEKRDNLKIPNHYIKLFDVA